MSEKSENRLRSDVWSMGLLAVITLVAAALRFYQIGKHSLWNDEIFSYTFSKGDLLKVLPNDPNMSLFYALVHYWVRIFPHASDGGLRALSAVLSVLGIPAVYLLGRASAGDRKTGQAVGLTAALLVAFNAYSIQYAQEFRSYSLTFLLATLSTLFLIRLMEADGSGARWAVLYAIASAACVYSHYLAGFILLAHAAALPLLLTAKEKVLGRMKAVLLCWIGAAVLVLPAGVLAYNKGPSGLVWVPAPTLRTLKEFIVYLSGKQGLWLAALYLALAAFGFLAGAGGPQRTPFQRWKIGLLASCLVLPPALGYGFSRLVLPIFMPAYFFYVMPYLAVLAAGGIAALADSDRQPGWLPRARAAAGAGLLAALLALSAAGIRSYFSEYQKDDWRGAARFLAAHCSNALRLYYVPWMENNAVYYSPGLASQAKPWWGSLVAENPDADRIAAALPGDYREVCLVLGHTGIGERAVQAEKIRRGIRQVYPRAAHQPFKGVDVYLFRLQE